MCTCNSTSFIERAFREKSTIKKASDVEFVYLNQISGPTIPAWNVKRKEFSINGLSYVEMRKQPDSWVDVYIDKNTHVLDVVKFFNSEWKQDHYIKPKRRGNKKKTI